MMDECGHQKLLRFQKGYVKEKLTADQVKEDERDYFLERKYPSFGNLVPRDVASRNAKEMVDEGKGVGGSGFAVFLDFAEAIKRLGRRYGKG